MKKLKTAVIVTIVIFVFITAVGYVLPSTLHVQRSISVNASPPVIYPLIANLKTGWSQWRPFRDEDPQMLLAYSGPDAGPGATESWQSQKIGNGTLAIISADPNRGVNVSLDIGAGAFRAVGSILYEQNGSRTTVTWSDDFDFGRNPYKRYLGLILGGPVGKEFERGLSMLKSQAESRVARNDG
jgi:hypothetical protein